MFIDEDIKFLKDKTNELNLRIKSLTRLIIACLISMTFRDVSIIINYSIAEDN